MIKRGAGVSNEEEVRSAGRGSIRVKERSTEEGQGFRTEAKVRGYQVEPDRLVRWDLGSRSSCCRLSYRWGVPQEIEICLRDSNPEKS